jgi:cobalamin biosynthesis protein CbiD
LGVAPANAFDGDDDDDVASGGLIIPNADFGPNNGPWARVEWDGGEGVEVFKGEGVVDDPTCADEHRGR